MRVTAWRICKQKRAATAFTGEGALRYGGRWNHPGTALVYTSSSIALAVLEMLVHVGGEQLLPSYVVIPVEFDDSLITIADLTRLSKDWRHPSSLDQTRAIGDDWGASRRSAVLRVPSAITGEANYLLNPSHTDFPQIEIGLPQPLEMDQRLRN